jgi:hypothetical protein
VLTSSATSAIGSRYAALTFGYSEDCTMSLDTAYSAFADESGLGERFLGIGALFLPTSNVAEVEGCLEKFCTARGFFGREMSWKKCSQSKVERYREFIELFFSLAAGRPPLDFRALVVDQQRYPLAWGKDTEEEGFYRFYHSLLSRSLATFARHAASYQLHVAIAPDRYAHRGDILQRTVGGTIGRASGRTWQVVEVIRGRPKSYRVHQMADILLGAVTARLNARAPDSHKQDLIALVEERVGQRLDHDFKPGARPFNVWFFARKGEKRWAAGADGTVG